MLNGRPANRPIGSPVSESLVGLHQEVQLVEEIHWSAVSLAVHLEIEFSGLACSESSDGKPFIYTRPADRLSELSRRFALSIAYK